MEPIEVFADIWCPFTHVGLRRLVERRSSAGSDRPIRVRAWPLELVNGAALDAEFIGEEIEDLRTQVSPDLFTGFRVERFPTSTIAALALAERAYAGSVTTGEAVSLALRDALFENGRDIGDKGVLREIAERFAVPMPSENDVEAVRVSHTEGKARGVVGSPHFFLDGEGFFCPGLAIQRIDGHLKIRAKADEFEAFAARCFER